MKSTNHTRHILHLTLISVWVMLVACTGTTTPTPDAPALNIPIASATPFPTPLAQFVTATSLPSSTPLNSESPTNVPTATVVLNVFAGSIQAQGDADSVDILNGPQGIIKDNVNDLAPVTVVGRSDDGQWLEIQLANGIAGWVRTNNVLTDATMNNLRITDYIPQETSTPSPDAIVKSDAAGLRLRTRPNTNSDVLVNLDAGDILTVIGRNRDSEWIQVITPNRQRGWVMAQYVDIYVDVLRLPITFRWQGGENNTNDDSTPPPSPSTSVISNITERAKDLFDRGLSLGNRPNVFSKVGDSITVATWFLYPIGWGQQQLGNYSYLQSVIDYFSSEIVRDGNNAFSNVPLSADNQWTTNDLLNPARGNPEICGSNETPLDCEYRITRPSIALIMIGTNDVGIMDGAIYRRNLEAILDKTIARNILPVLSTLPRRSGYDAQIEEFNEIIRTTATQYQIPIWEFNSVLEPLPANGLDGDGVHPSYAPDTLGQWESAANFIGTNLNYGYNQRNLSALQVLDALWRQIILDE